MTTKLTRRERERQRHRKEILSAARNIFARKGFEGASMAEIAERAEFAVGTLYKLFDDKRALYRALILDTVLEFERILTEALATPGTEVEKIERYIEQKAAVFVRHIPTARLYFAMTAGAVFAPSAGLDPGSVEAYERIQKRLEHLFRTGIRKKLFCPADPRMMMLALEGMSNAFMNELVARPDDLNAEVLAEATKTFFFERVCLKRR